MISKPNTHTPWIILEKAVGETPLECMETWRSSKPELAGVPLAYAGRLDPMASGKLLILIGDECRHQALYHGLDKEYVFSVLFGTASDTGDVLGIIQEQGSRNVTADRLTQVSTNLTGQITLPYPAFSSRTVHGKPLHTWAVEGRLNEIKVPHKTSEIYLLKLHGLVSVSRNDIYHTACNKIDSLPTVTDPRKALGNDFRRPDVKASWLRFKNTGTPDDRFVVATFTCLASSGTYMRSLTEEIALRLGTSGLAFSIHRTEIGKYDPESLRWKQRF